MGEHESPSPATYSLSLSEEERWRYQSMATAAAANESEEWRAAGIVEGARVADVGCGPGAVLRVLAEQVGANGSVTGIDADPAAIAHALEQVADLPQAAAQVGTATNSGLKPESFDVVMCRHVLAHNGGQESAIVAHLASLARAGGSVYLVDVDYTMLRLTTDDPDIHDLYNRYGTFQQARGNDMSVGLRLGNLLSDAGLALERFACRAPVVRVPPGARPPAWAARQEMVAAGAATEADVERWEKAFRRLDASEVRPWVFPATFIAVGRRQ